MYRDKSEYTAEENQERAIVFWGIFFLSRVTTVHTILGQHTFSNSAFVFSSCWCFSAILNTRNGSKCLGSLLKVQLATSPQVIPLESFPDVPTAPYQNFQKHSKTSIPTQAQHLVICARQAMEKENPMPSALRRLMCRKRTWRLHSPPGAWPGQARGGSRQGCGKNQDPVLQSLLLSHWGCGYGATFLGQTLIRNKAEMLLASLCKPNTQLHGAGSVVNSRFILLSWHRNQAQVCIGEKGRGHSFKKNNNNGFLVWASPGTWGPAASSSFSKSLVVRKSLSVIAPNNK